MRNLVVSNCLTLTEDTNHKLCLVGLDSLQSLIECQTAAFQPYISMTFDLLISKYGDIKVGKWIRFEIFFLSNTATSSLLIKLLSSCVCSCFLNRALLHCLLSKMMLNLLLAVSSAITFKYSPTFCLR